MAKNKPIEEVEEDDDFDGEVVEGLIDDPELSANHD
jgi:hypothetical protein